MNRHLKILISLVHAYISLFLLYMAYRQGLKTIPYFLPAQWHRDFNILMSVSVFLSLLLLVISNRPARLLIIIIRFIAVILTGLPFGSSLTAETLLMAGLIIDICFSLSFNTALLFLITGIGISLITQTNIPVYSVTVFKPSGNNLLLYFASLAGISFLGLLFRYLVDLLIKRTSELNEKMKIIENLIGANRGYLEYASSIEEESSEKERKRIITELHDVIGQSFTNILAIVNAATKHLPEEEELEDVFSVIQNQASNGLSETRAVLYKLHTFQPSTPPGTQEINRLIKVFTKSTGVKVDVNWANLPWDLGPELNTLVFNIIRESMINSFRHGKATRINIHFRIEKSILFLSITDNGLGASSFKKGIGLTTMEERVHGAGGNIKFSSMGKEFSVYAELPVKKKAEEQQNNEYTYS